MKKKTIEYVDVDIGYDLAENWYRAKVVDRKFVNSLWGDEKEENLLVEICDGSRMWVKYWKTIN